MKNKKLKVGIVFDDSLDYNDGVQQYVRTLGRWLIKNGHQVRFLVGETNNDSDIKKFTYSLSRNIKVNGNQNTMHLPAFSNGQEISKVLKKENFDLLHVMTPYNPLMGGRVISRSKNIPIVSHFHMVGGTKLINYGGKLLSIVQARTLKKITKFLGVSEATREYAKKYFNIDLEISPNPVDISNFKKGKVKDFLVGEKATITFIGRLVERKGARHLLAALRILHQQGKLKGVLVHICSDGELRTELEDYTLEHGLSDNVIFHGYIEENEKADFLTSADLAIFPSTGGEAFGIVLVEAMASSNCVVLGGDNSGYRTVLGGYPELLFDPEDHAMLAKKITHFLEDKKASQKALDWQKNEVKKYDIENVGKDVLAHYYEALQLYTDR